MTGLVIFVILLIFGFIGPLIYGKSYADLNSSAQSVPPGHQGYLLGSDAIGRDLLAGLMSGVQRSLFIVLLFIVIALPLGLLVGALAGYFGGWVDSVLMRVVDLILTVPLLVVLIVVASNFPGSRTPLGVGIILGLFGWLDLARIVRSQFLSLREKEYVEAAHAAGRLQQPDHLQAPDPERRSGSLIVWTTLAAATAIILEASLTYLGFGVNGANETSLGRLVSDGVQAASTRPWLFYFPGITAADHRAVDQPDRRRDPGRLRPEQPPRAGLRRNSMSTNGATAASSSGTLSRGRTQSLPGFDASAPLLRGRPTSTSASRPRTGSCTPSAASTTRCAPVRCSASSASPAPASRSPRWRSWACCPATPGSTGSVKLPRPGAARPERPRACRGSAARASR